MSNSSAILITAINCIRYCQSVSKDCFDAAYNTGLRSSISVTLRELDEIESGIMTYCHGFDQHFDSLPPISDLIAQLRIRIMLHFKPTDSHIAEQMIRALTDSRITLVRASNQTSLRDQISAVLIHRLLGSFAVCAKSFHSYL